MGPVSLYATTLRTHTCGELTPAHVGRRVSLAGWVERVQRGRQLFLRDGHGTARVVLPGRVEPAVREAVEALEPGEVARVEGIVIRLPGAPPAAPGAPSNAGSPTTTGLPKAALDVPAAAMRRRSRPLVT